MGNKKELLNKLNNEFNLVKLGFEKIEIDEFAGTTSYDPRIVAFVNDEVYTISQKKFNKNQQTFNDTIKNSKEIFFVKQNIKDDEFEITTNDNLIALKKYEKYQEIQRLKLADTKKAKRSVRRDSDEMSKGILVNPDHLSKEIKSRRDRNLKNKKFTMK